MLVLLDIPFRKTLAFDVCSTQPLDSLLEQAKVRLGDAISWSSVYISGRHGLSASEALSVTDTPWLSLQGRVLGGKGGFGSTLRSQGNRMNSKPNTFDDCRDLYGRRLRTLKEAKTIVEKFEQEDKAREEAAERRRKKIADGLQEKPVKKYRFDDTEHTRNCEEIVESTKKTTRTALRKKLAKNKKTMDSESDSLASSSPSNASDSAELAGKAPLIPLFDGELSSSSDEDEGDDEDKSDEK